MSAGSTSASCASASGSPAASAVGSLTRRGGNPQRPRADRRSTCRRVRDGGDRLLIRLDAEPDRDRFDLEARIRAPGQQRRRRDARHAPAGQPRPRRRRQLDALARRGAARRLRAGATADLALRMDAGRFRVRGWAAPAPFLRGKLQRLTAPRVLVNGTRRLSPTAGSTAGCRCARPRCGVESRGAIDLAPRPLRRCRRSPPSCSARRPCSPT